MNRRLRMALRNLLRNRWRSALSAGALVIGVCQVIVGQGFLSGLVKGLAEEAVLSKIGAIQVYRAGYLDAEQDPLAFDLPDDPALVARLGAVAGVRAVSRRIQFEGMLSNGSISAVFVATAIDPRTEYEVCPRRRQLVAKGVAPLAAGDENGVLIGGALAEGLGVDRPDSSRFAGNEGRGATLIASATTQAGTPNALDVTYRGSLPEGDPTESRAGGVVPLALAQTLLRMPGRVTEYVLDVDEIDGVDAVAAGLRRALGPGYEVKTWRDRPQLRDLIDGTSGMAVFMTFLLAILVGSVIVNTVLMSVYERVREIGTMMALGVRRREVMAIFLVESAALGLAGAALGAALGCGIVALASSGIHMPATAAGGAVVVVPRIDLRFLVWAIAGATGIGILAALYPAWTASRMKPVDALRAI